VYILDEITTDCDLYAREALLNFLRTETEERGATILYATHIFDCLADWATHIVFFAHGEIQRCCAMSELKEYHDLVAAKDRVPLYTLMKQWVFQEYPDAAEPAGDTGPVCPQFEGPIVEMKNMSFSYAQGLPPVLKDMTLAVERGSRCLVVGANGACKSTVMSILGGKRMIPRGNSFVFGKCPFNDTSCGYDVMYMGDWWRTKGYMNLRFGELLKPEVRASKRCLHLAKILEVDFDWKVNDCSDGMRRRCQLLEILAEPKAVYLMDEITSDLDIYAREGILNFLRVESEVRGATILYCTHIFDHLEGWPSHLLHLSQGTVVKCCAISDIDEYSQLLKEEANCPLYNLIRRWVYDEYDVLIEQKRKAPKIVDTNLDGRIPNLGLAGPFQMACGG
jgi:CCR4-NOT complex subunit CAF16